MDRTYSELKRVGVLANGDELLLHGYKYRVDQVGTGHYYLHNCDGYNNAAVFDKLGRDKCAWAKTFGSTCEGDFPEFKSLQELTSFVVSIYEEPEFNAGDYVTINEREHPAFDYPASFVDDMAKYSGKTFPIDDLCVTDSAEGRKLSNGDPHWYYLKTPSGAWTWHSSMFRKATAEEVLVAQGVKGDVGAKCDCGSSSDSITGDDGTPKLKAKYLEEIKTFSVEEILGGNTDCTLRLPKNTDKVHHINL